MKSIQLDPNDFAGPPGAWPTHCYTRMKDAGFKLKPLPTILPTGGDVMACLEGAWQVTRGRLGILIVVQSD